MGYELRRKRDKKKFTIQSEQVGLAQSAQWRILYMRIIYMKFKFNI